MNSKLSIAAALALLAACSPDSAPTSASTDAKAASPKPGAVMTREEAAVKKYPVSMSDEEWKKKLTPEQYEVCRQKGTERPFCEPYVASEKHGKGKYYCAACGNPLFESGSKFHSGTGWPSFFTPVSETAVDRIRDLSHGMDRVEVVCGQCGSHLGHVFDDGPKPTGLRYCMNGVSLKFVGETKEK